MTEVEVELCLTIEIETEKITSSREVVTMKAIKTVDPLDLMESANSCKEIIEEADKKKEILVIMKAEITIEIIEIGMIIEVEIIKEVAKEIMKAKVTKKEVADTIEIITRDPTNQVKEIIDSIQINKMDKEGMVTKKDITLVSNPEEIIIEASLVDSTETNKEEVEAIPDLIIMIEALVVVEVMEEDHKEMSDSKIIKMKVEEVEEEVEQVGTAGKMIKSNNENHSLYSLSLL